jgi:subtilisin family serine protease
LPSAGQGGVNGLHTNSFGGTSSATPLAAGVTVLVLSVDPELTRDQVKRILEQTADKIGPAGTYDVNGFSQIYGFGCVNAAGAVAAAQAARANRASGPVAATGRRRRRAA